MAIIKTDNWEFPKHIVTEHEGLQGTAVSTVVDVRDLQDEDIITVVIGKHTTKDTNMDMMLEIEQAFKDSPYSIVEVVRRRYVEDEDGGIKFTPLHIGGVFKSPYMLIKGKALNHLGGFSDYQSAKLVMNDLCNKARLFSINVGTLEHPRIHLNPPPKDNTSHGEIDRFIKNWFGVLADRDVRNTNHNGTYLDITTGETLTLSETRDMFRTIREKLGVSNG